MRLERGFWTLNRLVGAAVAVSGAVIALVRCWLWLAQWASPFIASFALALLLCTFAALGTALSRGWSINAPERSGRSRPRRRGAAASRSHAGPQSLPS